MRVTDSGGAFLDRSLAVQVLDAQELPTGTPLVNGAGQTGKQLATDGWTGTPAFLVGDLFGYVDPSGRSVMHQVVADAAVSVAATAVSVTATVVDRAGNVRVVHRADNAGPHTLGASAQKAFTSASARNTTLAMMEASQKNPAAANLVHIPGYLLLGGGVPVRSGNEVIGAIGVGGAPGGHLDEQCAVAALEQAKDLLQ